MSIRMKSLRERERPVIPAVEMKNFEVAASSRKGKLCKGEDCWEFGAVCHKLSGLV